MKPLIFNHAHFRFYQSLNDFLPPARRQIRFVYSFEGRPAVRDAIEALGIPHPEVGKIVVHKESVNFAHRLNNGDRVAVYPWLTSFYGDDDLSGKINLPAPYCFILDVNLGKLCRYLRLLGFDCVWRNSLNDDEIVRLAAMERRIILTRDIPLLKQKTVVDGYWVRNTSLREQVSEIITRYELRDQIRPFSRCMVCNGLIIQAERESVKPDIPDKIFESFQDFFQCTDCGKIYWKGSHYDRMNAELKNALQYLPTIN